MGTLKYTWIQFLRITILEPDHGTQMQNSTNTLTKPGSPWSVPRGPRPKRTVQRSEQKCVYSAQHAAPARPHRVPGVEGVGGEQRRGRDRPENGRRGGPATGRLTDVAKMNQRLVQVSPSQGQTRRKTLLLRTHQQTQRGGDNPLQNIHISVPWHNGIGDRPSIIFVCLLV